MCEAWQLPAGSDYLIKDNGCHWARTAARYWWRPHASSTVSVIIFHRFQHKMPGHPLQGHWNYYYLKLCYQLIFSFQRTVIRIPVGDTDFVLFDPLPIGSQEPSRTPAIINIDMMSVSWTGALWEREREREREREQHILFTHIVTEFLNLNSNITQKSLQLYQMNALFVLYYLQMGWNPGVTVCEFVLVVLFVLLCLKYCWKIGQNFKWSDNKLQRQLNPSDKKYHNKKI